MALSPIELCDICQDDIDYSIDTVYLFTWNPNKKFYPDNGLTHNKWNEMIVKVLKHFNRCMKWYCILPEVSDMGRVHCHGWFVIKDKIKWIKSVKPKMEKRGFCKFNKLRHVNGFNYYTKDIDVAANYFNYYPYCHYNNDTILKEMHKDITLKTKKKTEQLKSMDLTVFFNIN